MHNHQHSFCKHENVRYCPHCNVCFCLNCSLEWGQKVTYAYSPYIWRYEGIPYTITWSSTGTTYSMANPDGKNVTDAGVISAFNSSMRDTVGCKSVCTHN